MIIVFISDDDLQMPGTSRYTASFGPTDYMPDSEGSYIKLDVIMGNEP